MQQLVNKLISEGWYLVNVNADDTSSRWANGHYQEKVVYRPHSNAYHIIPPNKRQNWAAEFRTVNYGALVIYVPHWALENRQLGPPPGIPTMLVDNQPGAPPGMPARFGKRRMW